MNYNRKAVEAFLRQPWSNIERNLAVDVLEWMNIAAALAGQLDATMRGIHEDRANEAALASYRSAIAEQPNTALSLKNPRNKLEANKPESADKDGKG